MHLKASAFKSAAIGLVTIATFTSAFVASPALANRSGEAQLQRLLSPHTNFIRVSRAARAATGDPDITVIDRRGRSGEVYQCSFLTRYGRRIMICD